MVSNDTKTIKLKLNVWRQKGNNQAGKFEVYHLEDISVDMSFLEMLDVLNQKLIHEGKDPIVFDHDCREGICGTCSMSINGEPHGPNKSTTACQLHMRSFEDGQELYVEPFRAKAFPIIKDLTVDRSAFDRIISAGGFVSVSTGNPQDANNLPIPKDDADDAFASAACIGCGACVAACKNASAMLFVSSKINHLNRVPQGRVEATKRVRKMIAQMDIEGFGACSNTEACSAACPKDISMTNIANMNAGFLKSFLKK